MRRAALSLIALLGLIALLAAALWRWQTQLDVGPSSSRPGDIARGAYLAQVGNCAGCHTARGGTPLAGGRGIPTPFGTVFSTNLTPDAKTGLGAWSPDDFWRAMHLGQSRDGRLLSPAFPYENTTHLSREDSDAIFAWLQGQPPSEAPSRPNELRWPYNTQIALAAWRALYFRPATAELPRGEYLVRGLMHCSACHSARTVIGGSGGTDRFDGGMLFGLGWQAPSLHDPAEAGVQRWTSEQVQRWLREGRVDGHSALGPMGEVVLGSTSALNDVDLAAVTGYLRALPARAVARPAAAEPEVSRRELGAQRYREHCAACHGTQGQGGRTEDGGLAYPPLAGNRTVTQASAHNLLRVIERGAYSPSTPGNPRPFGMPPFAGRLNDAELAALASYLRTAFGNQAGEIDSVEVLRLRQSANTH